MGGGQTREKSAISPGLSDSITCFNTSTYNSDEATHPIQTHWPGILVRRSPKGGGAFAYLWATGMDHSRPKKVRSERISTKVGEDPAARRPGRCPESRVPA